MAGVIGEVTQNKNGLASQFMAQVLGNVTVQSRNDYASFSVNLQAGYYTTLVITIATTNYDTCTLLLTLSKWNKDYVSNAVAIGAKSAINTLHYNIEGNKFSIFLRPNDNYAQVRVRNLIWWGVGQISSTVVSSLPSTAVVLSAG